MANEATILRIRAQVENLEGLNRARSAVRNFATESKAASNDLGNWIRRLTLGVCSIYVHEATSLDMIKEPPRETT